MSSWVDVYWKFKFLPPTFWAVSYGICNGKSVNKLLFSLFSSLSLFDMIESLFLDYAFFIEMFETF